MVTHADAEEFARCMDVGGVAIFPADTVYGLACEPDTPEAVRRLYALKDRCPGKPAAVMFFDRAPALEALPGLGERTRAAFERLLPGAVTLLLPNPLRRFPLACGPDPETLGVRVPALGDALAPLLSVRRPVLQSSANHTGGPDARTLAVVPAAIRAGVDLLIDGGELAGMPSTVIDLRGYEAEGEWSVARVGAVAPAAVEAALAP